MKIIIDPGHGNLGNTKAGLRPDPGTVSPRGVQESVVALQYALTLKHVLVEAGYTVVMARNSEVKTPYHARTNLCGPGDTYISIHLNMPGSYGLMYYRTGDDKSLRLAKKLQDRLRLKYLWATKRSRFGRLYIDDVPASARSVMIEIDAIDRVQNTKENRLRLANEVLAVLKEDE